MVRIFVPRSPYLPQPDFSASPISRPVSSNSDNHTRKKPGSLHAGMENLQQSDLMLLNDNDKAELRRFINNETKRTQIQARTSPAQISDLDLADLLADHTLSIDRIPRLDRRLLEEVCRRHPQLPAGQEGAGLHDKLRGPVPRCQYAYIEASVQHEVTDMMTELGGAVGRLMYCTRSGRRCIFVHTSQRQHL